MTRAANGGRRLAKYELKAEAARSAHEIWRDEFARPQKGTAPPDRPAEAEAPNKPPMPRVMAMNSTTEKLELLLAENPRGLLHMRDELAGWLGGFDRYGGEGADRAFFLECWNGGSPCERSGKV